MVNTDNDKRIHFIVQSMNKQIGGMLGYYTKISSNCIVAKKAQKLNFKTISVTEFGKLNYLKINLSIKNNNINITVFTRWYFGILTFFVLIIIGSFTIPGSLRPGRDIGILTSAFLFLLFHEINARIKIKNSISKSLNDINEFDTKNYKLFLL